jgi:tetratricopeptide (TPR) repeat protein
VQERAPAARVAGVAAALVVAVAAVYQPVGGFGYVTYDDPEYVARSPMVQGGLGLAALRGSFLEVHHGNWHPLTTLSFLLDVELFGLDPGAQHRVNLALHALNTLLLFLLFERLTGALGRSAAVAALFALHPLHVESVAWISQRKDLLSTAFGLGAALAHAGYVRHPNWRRYALTLGLFAAGLLSKSMLVTWPFVLLLLDVWPLRRFEAAAASSAHRVRRALVEKLPMLALSAAVSGLTLWAQAQGGALRLEQQPLGVRLANAAGSYVVYLRQTLWPADLAVLYPWTGSPPTPVLFASLAVLCAATLLCSWRFRAQPYLFVGWLWYLGTLVPVLGLVQVGAHAHADRYTYIPLIGIFVAGVWAAGDALRHEPRLRVPAAVLGIGLLVALSWVTRRQLAVWEDSVALYRHAIAVTERNAVMYNNLGVALAGLGRPDEAIAVLSEGLAFPSPFVDLLSYNAALANADLGRDGEALALLDRALRVDPEYPEALYHKARALRRLGRLAEAVEALEQVVALVPQEADPQLELGLVLGQMGRPAEALARFEAAIALQPLHVEARISRAVALLELGDAEAAVEELEHVLQLRPGHEAALHYLEMARRP